MLSQTLPEVRSILIASDAQADASTIENGLPTLIERFSMLDAAPAQIIKTLSINESDLLIIAEQILDQDTLQTVKAILAVKATPIILFVKHDPNNLVTQAVKAGVSSCVVDGLSSSRMIPLIAVAIERFKLYAALQDELTKSKENLATRKIVEQAKGYLMQTKNLSEEDAYKTLRTMAMRKGKTLKEIAEAIITMSDLL